MMEVLVAMLVIGTGALAIAMLQLHALRSGQDSSLQARATLMAQELAELRAALPPPPGATDPTLFSSLPAARRSVDWNRAACGPRIHPGRTGRLERPAGPRFPEHAPPSAAMHSKRHIRTGTAMGCHQPGRAQAGVAPPRCGQRVRSRRRTAADPGAGALTMCATRCRLQLPGQGGLTLVELMIALAVGLLVVLVAGTLLQQAQRLPEMDDAARVEETGRLVLDHLQLALRQASHLPVEMLTGHPAVARAGLRGLDDNRQAESLDPARGVFGSSTGDGVNHSDLLMLGFFGAPRGSRARSAIAAAPMPQRTPGGSRAQLGDLFRRPGLATSPNCAAATRARTATGPRMPSRAAWRPCSCATPSTATAMAVRTAGWTPRPCRLRPGATWCWCAWRCW
jgi:Tfp pilus assembly protein PilV